jgi:hypothetical protein
VLGAGLTPNQALHLTGGACRLFQAHSSPMPRRQVSWVVRRREGLAVGLGDWLGRLFGGKPRLRDEVPEVIGRVTDEQGHQQVLHRGPLQHESLTPDQLQRIGRLRDVLAEAYPMTLDGWVDGFMRDAHPESEIQIIEACAAVYQRLSAQASLGPGEKKRLYSVLCVISAGGAGPELASAVPAGRGLPDVEAIAAMYRDARQAGGRP